MAHPLGETGGSRFPAAARLSLHWLHALPGSSRHAGAAQARQPVRAQAPRGGRGRSAHAGDDDGPVGRHDSGLGASAGPTPTGGPWERTRGGPGSAGWWDASSGAKKLRASAGQGGRPPPPTRLESAPAAPGDPDPRLTRRPRSHAAPPEAPPPDFGPLWPARAILTGALGASRLHCAPPAARGGRGRGKAALARHRRSTAPRRGPDERRGRRLRAVSPATSSGRFPGNARAARCSRGHGCSVPPRPPPGSRPPRRAVLRGASSGGPLGALLGLAGVRVRGHLRPGGGPGAGGERGRRGGRAGAARRPRALCARGPVGQTPRAACPCSETLRLAPAERCALR